MELTLKNLILTMVHVHQAKSMWLRPWQLENMQGVKVVGTRDAAVHIVRDEKSLTAKRIVMIKISKVCQVLVKAHQRERRLF